MFKSKFYVLILLVVSLVISSCGQKKTEVTNDPAADANVTAPGELPIVKEKISLNIGLPGAPTVTDYETNAYTVWLREQTNIDISFTLFPYVDSAKKLDIVLASNGELPEVLIGFNMNDSFFQRYADQEVFLTLNDYVENDAFWLNKMFEETNVPNLKKHLISANGNMYFMPYLTEQTGNYWPNKAWINQSWLDKLGLPVPETTEDFRAVLKAFKEKDPNGNGKADEIPFSGSKNGFMQNPYNFLFNAFIYADIQDNNYYLVENGKVDVAYNKPEWKAALKYMSELASEGLLDIQSFVQDSQSLKTIAQNPDSNILGSVPSASLGELFGTVKERLAEYVGLPPLKGPEGVQYSYMRAQTPQTLGIITKYCKNPLAAFRLMDFMLSEESALRARYGVPGVDWLEPTEDDKCMFENIGAEAKVITILPYGTVQNSHWQSMHPVFRSLAISDGMAWDGDPLNDEYLKALYLPLYMNKGPKEYVTKQLFTLDEAEEIDALRAEINAFVTESIGMFIAGEKNVDTEWDKYISDLEKMNLKRYIELSQSGYDKFSK